MRNIDVAAELTRLGIDFTSHGKDEWRVRCPYHEDNTPSCDVSQRKMSFLCRSCRVTGDVFTLFVKLTGLPRHVLLSQFEATTDKPVEVSVVERYHDRIWTATVLLEALYKRGVSDDTIKRRLLGEHDGRVTIPIANAAGMFVNLRQYLPGATDVPKTINLRGRGTPPRLYPFDQLQYREIVILGGEIKALASIERLNDHSIGAISLTAGENEWVPGNDEYFRGKHVWVVGDIDEVGIHSAEYRCARLSQVADWIGRVDLPLDKSKFPKGDVNDFFELGGDLLELLRATKPWVGKLHPAQRLADAAPADVSIREAMASDMVNRRFQSKISITAVGQDSYFIPKDVLPTCKRDQDFCSSCPVYHTDPGTKLLVPPESSSILSMIDTNAKYLGDEIRDAVGIPKCEAVTFEVETNYKVYETRVQRAINLTAQDSDKTAVSAVLVDEDTELNETYIVTGKSVPHPKTQSCVAIISKADPVADALTGFHLENPKELEMYRPKKWTVESIDERLDTIYTEFEMNITGIYERRGLHVAVDMTYHSMLSVEFRGSMEKAVLETLIVGDSGQGKSRTTDKFREYYGLGEKMDAKNATVAGIMGGLEQANGKWYIQWGVIPTHDRRLVIIEELKGMRTEVLSKLTEMRSSGEAEIPKIIRRKAQARTRLICNSNVRRRGATLDSFSYGVAAVLDLIQSPEDVRRFDIAIVLNKNEVNSEQVNTMRDRVPTTFTPDQARKLVLWCWTRDTTQVVLPPELQTMMVDAANRLCNEFSDTIPLLDRGSSKVKIMRLACAVAGRTFSTSDDSLSLVVRPCHVEWAEKFFREEYSKPAHGYLEMSKRLVKQEKIADPELIKKELSTLPHLVQTLESMLFKDSMEHQDFLDWTGWTDDEVGLLLGKLVRNNCVSREGRGYTKTGSFTNMLRELMKNPPERPAHIPEKEECKY